MKFILRFFKFRSSKQLLFSFWAAGMVVFVAAVVVVGSMFLASRLKQALSADELERPEPPIQFDIDGFEKLHLVQ